MGEDFAVRRAGGGEADFDDIEAGGDGVVAEFLEVSLGGAEDAALFAVVNGVCGALKGGGVAGFDFDKDEGVLVAADEVDFAPFGAVVADEDLVAGAAEGAGGGAFAEGATVGGIRG